MIRGLFKYLFPGLRLHERLPLLPRGLSSDHRSTAEADPADARYILAKSAARTQADAHRLLSKHPAKTARHVAKVKRRERRRESRLSKAWRKLRELFK